MPYADLDGCLVKHVYFIGICGTGVGALAGLLKSQGYEVRGSDEHVYPPMSTKLREWGIPILEGYDAKHLDPPPDLVVVGNVIRAGNPEAVFSREAGLPTLSMPQAVARFGIGNKHSVVVAGTHGKTTTSALAAHVLTEAGVDPSYLVGGAMVGYRASFHHGAGDVFVVEGDEYDTAYFDKGPKFLHYRPKTAIITSLEFDHADIFADVDAVKSAFARLLRIVPPEGHVVMWHGAALARELLPENCRAKVTLYATEFHKDAQLWLQRYTVGPEGLTLWPVVHDRAWAPIAVPLWGEFSACNALAVLGALQPLGVTEEAFRRGFGSFAGVRRRMEVLGTPGGVCVVDDFAHHPTAVAKTLEAARQRWPEARIWAVFEPRSATSRRNVFQQEYAAAFVLADKVVIASHARLDEVPKEERFDPELLVRTLVKEGVDAHFCPHVAGIVHTLISGAANGDVIMILSNGDFDGLHAKLMAGLTRRASEG